MTPRIVAGYRLASALARIVPARPGAAVARAIGRLVGRLDGDRRRIVERNLRRVRPDGPTGPELRRASTRSSPPTPTTTFIAFASRP
ncbi:MAG: hypothetical protein Ct9H300mP31_11790 [Acidimicrobiaceae bacterium]|nr:MAG: hypothetical protein Ct9H300mP31_11790 [Acidimicrobiaceae bacterium]